MLLERHTNNQVGLSKYYQSCYEKKKIVKTIFFSLCFSLLGYLALGAVLFFSQRSMIYFPSAQDFESCVGFSAYEKVVHNSTRMYLKRQSRDLVVYYHGNAGSACDRSSTAAVFEESGKSVLYVEYAGYSNDPEPPSRARILEDVRNVHQFIDENGYQQVIVYGQSIGSGPASYHASLGGVERLILVTPFARLSDVAQSQFPLYPVGFLLREEYDNVSWLSGYDGEIVILHGDSDEVIADRFSRDLYEQVPGEKKEYILLEGLGHNDIWRSPEFRSRVKGLVIDTANQK